MPRKIPGLDEGAETFYTEAGAIKMFKALREFEGGNVGIVVGVPHKCPIAPVEVTFSLHDYFKDRGIRDKVNIKYHYPINRIHSIENVAKWAQPEFDRMGVEYETLFNVEEVDAENKVVKSMKKSEIPSTPKLKFKFKKGIHNNLLTNWKELIDLLKKTHKNSENTYMIQDIFKAMFFNNEQLDAGTNNKKKTPSKGNSNMKTSKLVTVKGKKSNINTL